MIPRYFDPFELTIKVFNWYMWRLFPSKHHFAFYPLVLRLLQEDKPGYSIYILNLTPICRVAVRERGPLHPSTCYLRLVKEQILPLLRYSTQEKGPCTALGQQSRADPVDKGVGEPAPRTWVLETCPHSSSAL